MPANGWKSTIGVAIMRSSSSVEELDCLVLKGGCDSAGSAFGLLVLSTFQLLKHEFFLFSAFEEVDFDGVVANNMISKGKTYS